MPDPVLHEALRRLAAEAAMRFSSLVATGEEIPFDVAEDSGQHTFYRYVPLTSRFVRDHGEELRSLPSFGPACSAVGAADVAAPYLEARGVAVPEDTEERAAEMLITFIARLWEGSAEFTLEKTRLESALRELDAEAQDPLEADVLLAPLVGLQMPPHRLQLPSGVRIVRADTVEAPDDARRSEGMHRSPWEPQFIALAERDSGPEGSASAMRVLRELISVLRLFKEGGVGLGPYVFASTGEERWRRIATGAPATRLGGYMLSEAEAGELADFACRLEARPDPEGALAWAIARFEMGCDRPTALEGLSDHLLALRAIFEGDGPVGATLEMRVAALISEPPEREEACEKVRVAFELERALMWGEALDTGSALGLAAWLEDGVRAVLREAALGEHGTALSNAADEALIAAGLEGGEGSPEQMGETSEWDVIVSEEPVKGASGREEAADLVAGGAGTAAEIDASAGPGAGDGEESPLEPHIGAKPGFDADMGIYGEDDPLYDDDRGLEPEFVDHEPDSDEEGQEIKVIKARKRDWLSEVSGHDEDETLEWPAPAGERREGEQVDSPRVRHLFPVPDDTDWDVGELEYRPSETEVR